MVISKSGRFLLLLFLLGLTSPAAVLAQEDDNSGTNPLNFTYDLRFITEMQWLKDDGGSLRKTTFEFRAPLGGDIANVTGAQSGAFVDMGKKFAIRMRAYWQELNVDDPAGTAFGSNSVSGIGDLDARVLWMAKANNTWGLAPGIEAFFNTASNDALGSGSTTLAPVVFFALFNKLGGGSIFAPGYQYVFNVSGNKVSRSNIDLYFVWMLSQGRNWLIVNPQIILDHENSKEFIQADAEFGYMIVPQYGIAGYIRPGVGIGADRPFDWNFEFAFKMVWR
jgi:hypothetical protein